MIEQAANIIGSILLIGGAVSIIISAIGLNRFPDFYCRLHAAGITDTLGAWLILAGVIIEVGFNIVAVKLGLIGLFLFFTAPTSSYAVANAAWLDHRLPKGTRMAENTQQTDKDQK